jgi:hypothetical protein
VSGAERPATWEGRSYESLSEEERIEVFTMAADYRGDVTLKLASGESVTGYVFTNEPKADPPHLRLFPELSESKRTVAHAEIVGLEFSGADKAFGQSWEHWVKRWETARELMEKGLDPGQFEPQPLD